MIEPELANDVLSLLSVLIGTIMEDEVDAAVSVLPIDADERVNRFGTLGRAGRDIVALAEAAQVVLRRSRHELSS